MIFVSLVNSFFEKKRIFSGSLSSREFIPPNIINKFRPYPLLIAAINYCKNLTSQYRLDSLSIQQTERNNSFAQTVQVGGARTWLYPPLIIINSRDKRFIMQLTVINRGESDGAEQPCSHADGGHLRFPRCKFHLT